MFINREGKKRVGVLRGGPSAEYDVSLQTGALVLKHMPQKYHPIDVLISKDEKWHVFGLERDAFRILDHLDVVFNCLHGHFGEDGKLQNFLEEHAVPYTGSGPLSSSFAMNKNISKQLFEKNDVKTPWHVSYKVDEQDVRNIALKIFREFPIPCVVKPVSSGSSLGVSIAKDLEGLVSAIKKAYEYSSVILFEEYIKGKEVACGIVEKYRDKDHYRLIPVEIVLEDGVEMHYFESKISGRSKKICPANISREEKEMVQSMAEEVHKAVGLSHYSISDFIVSDRGVYVLEVNSLPGLSEEHPIHTSLQASGIEFAHFLDHLIQLSFQRK